MRKDHLAKLGAPPTRPPGPLPELTGGPLHEEGGLTSTRRATYGGHTIEITTTYTITVDGTPLRAHVEVDDLGRVHYHGLPNYNFRSAVDLAKAVIDAEPSAFPRRRRPSGGGDGGHRHGGGGH
jgi:hypothetical protein